MRITQQMIADKLGITQSTVARILNKNPRDTYSQETVERVMAMAQDLGYSINHKRIFVRKPLNIACKLEVRLAADKSLFSTGSGLIVNMSRDGMLLRSIKLESEGEFIPLKPFYFEIFIPESGLQDFSLKASPIRISIQDEEIEFGVRFFSLQKKRMKILKDQFKL